jgi:hypothetical protein
MRLAIAGNVVVPAVLLLEEHGFAVVRMSDPSGETWTAQRGTIELSGEDPVQLLGLAALADARGENWHATDQQIDDVMRRFGLDSET